MNLFRRLLLISILALTPDASPAADLCPYLLNAGVDRIVSEISRIEAEKNQDLFFIAVYGWPDSGKSHLISILEKRFQSLGFDTQETGTTHGTYEAIRAVLRLRSVAPHPRKKLFIFHVTAPRGQAEDLEDAVDPHLGLTQIGQKVDLTIGISSSRMPDLPAGLYDLMVSNPRL